MKNKLLTICVSAAVVVAVAIGTVALFTSENVQKGLTNVDSTELWNNIMAKTINREKIVIKVSDKKIEMDKGEAYMSDNMVLMLPANVVTDGFDCAKNFYNDNRLVIEKGTSKAVMHLNTKRIKVYGNIYKIDEKVVKKDGVVYIPATLISSYFGYSYKWDSLENTATFYSDATETNYLPEKYSYLDADKCPETRDQGSYGTCWAFATLTAIESTLLPEEPLDFSEDHLTLNNSISTDQDEGGEYTMALAYLAAWQGPVFEKDDPYGDGKTNSKLEAVKHVQEVQIIPAKNYRQIKEMVYKYGGVQSSLYTSLQDSSSQSIYYNQLKSAYCYIGDEEPNHDIVIIGWDDKFPKESFNDGTIKEDGAFICKNSWGEDFGEEGIFYVSYEDTKIGVNNVCYTNIEDNDNYDNIYQSDLCGWIGTMGFKNENTAYFSNVYKSKKNENLAAVGFYATDENTEYQVYVCTNFENTTSLNNRTHIAAKGILKNSGYYTIKLDQEYGLKKGQEYAVIVKAYTPKSTKPIAVEMGNKKITDNVDLTDGKGYFSFNGKTWKSSEENECNICLKAFTNTKKK